MCFPFAFRERRVQSRGAERLARSLKGQNDETKSTRHLIHVFAPESINYARQSTSAKGVKTANRFNLFIPVSEKICQSRCLLSVVLFSLHTPPRLETRLGLERHIHLGASDKRPGFMDPEWCDETKTKQTNIRASSGSIHYSSPKQRQRAEKVVRELINSRAIPSHRANNSFY